MELGFQDLVSRTYTSLRMLTGQHSEADYADRLKKVSDPLFAAEATIPEAEQEVLSFIQRNKSEGTRTTLKMIIEKFERKPYGWWLAGIVCTVASLWARGKILANAEGNDLSETALLAKLKGYAQPCKSETDSAG